MNASHTRRLSRPWTGLALAVALALPLLLAAASALAEAISVSAAAALLRPQAWACWTCAPRRSSGPDICPAP